MTIKPADRPGRDREGLCGNVTLRLFQPVKNRSEKALGAGVLRSRDARSRMLHSPEQQSKPGGRFGLRPGKYLEAGFQAGGQGLSVARPAATVLLISTPSLLLVTGLGKIKAGVTLAWSPALFLT